MKEADRGDVRERERERGREREEVMERISVKATAHRLSAIVKGINQKSVTHTHTHKARETEREV